MTIFRRLKEIFIGSSTQKQEEVENSFFPMAKPKEPASRNPLEMDVKGGWDRVQLFAAALYWSRKLPGANHYIPRGVLTSSSTNQYQREADITQSFLQVVERSVVAEPVVSKEQFIIFVRELHAGMIECANSYAEWRPDDKNKHIDFASDYGPEEQEFWTAAQLAGLANDFMVKNMPWKTAMWIYDDGSCVSLGASNLGYNRKKSEKLMYQLYQPHPVDAKPSVSITPA